MDGIWIHHDRMHDRKGRRMAWEWVDSLCNYANVYRGHKKGFIQQIDTICGGCGKRVRFNPRRAMWKTRRGSTPQSLWLSRHENKSRGKLESIAQRLNGVDLSYHGEGFSTASELMREKSIQSIRGESNQ